MTKKSSKTFNIDTGVDKTTVSPGTVTGTDSSTNIVEQHSAENTDGRLPVVVRLLILIN